MQSTLGNNITNDSGSVTFKCPKCLKGTIIRTKNEREIVATYECPECGFTGPN